MVVYGCQFYLFIVFILQCLKIKEMHYVKSLNSVKFCPSFYKALITLACLLKAKQDSKHFNCLSSLNYHESCEIDGYYLFSFDGVELKHLSSAQLQSQGSFVPEPGIWQ